MNGVVERCVGAPVSYEELAHRPGERLTLRARGPRGSAIVKLYPAGRIDDVARTLEALADGPPVLEVPRVLGLDRPAHVLVVSDLRGMPLQDALLGDDLDRCRRAGAALAAWHEAWRDRVPEAFRPLTLADAIGRVRELARQSAPATRARVRDALSDPGEEWECATVVHGSLAANELLLTKKVALVGLDEAAAGPPELDVGCLLANIDLLELRRGASLEQAVGSLMEGYRGHGSLDPSLLDRCRALARLRLACTANEPLLLDRRRSPSLTVP